ncbi:Uncharacterized protein TCM_041242 [Theobroma cacao]|uniref:Uncharacterized protein n=1 Tax=Theobroma cacao TaxID=3641 RepID=A0A061GV62_THECC|nr:Uncharacterized protein TCM_041242 [Theobroma cacao]
MLLDVYPQGYFYAGLLHSIMIRQITERQSMDHELWFAIGKSKARLSKQEFCLITVLKSGPMPDVFRRPYEFWAMKAILALRKIVTPSGPKDNVHPRMCKWNCNQKPKNFYKTIQKLESFDQLWALEKLEPTTDEALREYFVDLDVLLSEGNEYVPIWHMEDWSDWGLGARQKRRSLKEKRASGGTKRMRTVVALVDELMDEGDDHGQGSEQPLDHGPIAPEPPTDLSQMQSGNNPSYAKVTTGLEAQIGPAPPQIGNQPPLTQSRTVNDGAVTTRQLRWIMRKHEKDMLELKASIQSLSVAMQTIEDRIVGRILDGLKSQVRYSIFACILMVYI